MHPVGQAETCGLSGKGEMKTVAIYARVSTADQTAESQLMELRSYAFRREFTVYKEYVDQVTGVVSKRKKGQGEAYKRLMDDAGQKRFDVVLVWKFDRFARSLQTLMEALQLFEDLGIDFISSTQNIDTTTSMGRLFFQIVGAFAEFERQIIVERVRAGLSNARAKGVKLGRPKGSSPDQEREILALHHQNRSLAEISKLTGRSRAGVWLVIQRLAGSSKSDILGLASSKSSPSPEVGSVRPGGVL